MGTIKDEEQNIDEKKKVYFFKKIKGILEKNGIEYWIEYGTLLGFLRDKKLIHWDHDIDLVALDFEKVKKIIPKFEEMKFKTKLRWSKSKYNTQLLQIYAPDIKKSSFHIDIYEFILINGKPARLETFKSNFLAKFLDISLGFIRKYGFITNSINNIIEKLVDFFSLKRTLIFPKTETELLDFYDTKVRVPKNAEEHVRFLYGENWRIPNKNHRNIESGVTKYKKGSRWVCELNE